MGTVRNVGIRAGDLTLEERTQLRDALRMPRGRYGAERAAQLSGVPTRTVYHWAQTGTLVPDYDESPKSWSYRDLVYLRLTAWLRATHLPLPTVVDVVDTARRRFAEPDAPGSTVVSTDGVGVALSEGFAVDALTGQRVFETMVDNVTTFDLLAPLEAPELGRGHLWGPNLVRPSRHTSISPWVLRGEPVLRGSRLSTGALYALRTSRRLKVADIVELYPGVDEDAVDDAIELETRLRMAA
jgi:DNA-binding transcriptional MerR regulator/uncharacterized protein (DUF433 family)